MSLLTADKPGVLERLASAMGSSDLAPDHEQIKPIDLITALAYTQTNPGASEHGSLEFAQIDPRTELAGVLVRVKYAGDRALGTRALHLLVHWVRHQRAFRKWPAGQHGRLDRFVEQGLAEWLYPICAECNGRQMTGLDRGEIVERRVRCRRCKGGGEVLESRQGRQGTYQLRRSCPACNGMGARTFQRVRQSKPELCGSCYGTGQRRAADAERAIALSVDVRIYERHWAKRFSWLAASLDGIDRLERNCLQSVLSGRIKRADVSVTGSR